MRARFQELDWRETPLGVLSLRRRWDPAVERDVHEIKLDDEFLMSSLFTTAEIEMARLALAGLPDGPLDVAVGGLGLGYTARAVLDDPRVVSLVVVEALAEVIEWHERGLLPAGATLRSDPRCRMIHGDFFGLVGASSGPDPTSPGRRFDAIVVDIDHSPHHLLHPGHARFYRTAGLRQLAGHLRPGGIFALWSDDPPDEDFRSALTAVYEGVAAETVRFENPVRGGTAANTVYLARRPAG